MNVTACRIGLVGTALTVLALVLPSAAAAPNLYSETVDSGSARVAVLAPKAGLYKPGEYLRISWKKRTPGKNVELALYSATTSGLRNKKVRKIAVGTTARRGWTTKGGAVRWRLPSNLPPGRYIIVVKSKLDTAWSDAFGVQAANAASKADSGPKLGPSTLVGAGIVKKVDIKIRGKQGTVVISNAKGDTTYEWGAGKCRSLESGLAGALATMAAIGNVEIQPRVRSVIESGKVLQRCMDGLVVVSGMPGSTTTPTS